MLPIFKDFDGFGIVVSGETKPNSKRFLIFTFKGDKRTGIWDYFLGRIFFHRIWMPENLTDLTFGSQKFGVHPLTLEARVYQDN